MVDPVISMIAAFCFGLLLLASGAHKLSNRNGFRAILAEYDLLPAALLSVASIAIGAFEFYLGSTWVFVLLGNTAPVLAKTTPMLTAALLGLYALAMGINLARGRDYIDCGCGFGGANSITKTNNGDSNHQHLSKWLVFRNMVMAAVALYSGFGTSGRSLGAIDIVITILAILSIILAYAAFNQLLQNRSTITSWRSAHV